MDERVIEREEVDKRRVFYRLLQSSGLVERIELRPRIDPLSINLQPDGSLL
jgi:hypothetical protein